MSTKASLSKSDGDKMKKRLALPSSTGLDYLYEYVDLVKRKLVLLNNKESSSLLEQLIEIEKKLDTVKNTKLSPVQSFTLVTEINEINQKAEKRNLNLLNRILPEQKDVSIALITTVGIVITGLISLISAVIVQRANTPASPTSSPTIMPGAANNVLNPDNRNVTVYFNNPANSPTIDLFIIRDGIEFDHFPVESGEIKIKHLPQGEYHYEVEVRANYPTLIPSSANCYIQWQESTSHTGSLGLSINEAIVQIKQFYLEPHEICLTETPASASP